MTNQKLIDLLLSLTHLPKETEWVEFKGDNAEPDEIGEYLSALANSAALHQKDAAYLVWGVEDVRIKLLEPASSQGIQKLGTRSSRTGSCGS